MAETKKGKTENQLTKEIEDRLIKNFLDLIILAEIKNQKKLSGYDIMKIINQKHNIFLSSGTIYSSLYANERKGLIKGTTIGRKTTFTITQTGEETLRSLIQSKKSLQHLVDNLIPT